MKRVSKAILGLSLLVGSASLAQDNFSAFYPAEDVDSPAYTQESNVDYSSSTVRLAKSSVSDETFKALYAKDAWEYEQKSKGDTSVVNSVESTISPELIKELYIES